MKNKKFNIRLLAVVIILIVLMASMIGSLNEGAECTNSPLEYAIKVANETSNVEMTCICEFTDPNFNKIYASKDGVSQKPFFDVNDYIYTKEP